MVHLVFGSSKMHIGRFSSSPSSQQTSVSYSRGSWSKEDLDPSTSQAIDRRRWLLGAGFFLAGAGAVVTFGSLKPAAASKSPSRDKSTATARKQEDLPAWALEMRELPAEELISKAGDFERKSTRHYGDRRLAIGFERLLIHALKARFPECDLAGACAARSLARLGRVDLVGIWLSEIDAREGFLETKSAAHKVLAREARRRKRLHNQ